MNRKDELVKLFNQIKNENIKNLCIPLIDEVIYLENEISNIKKLPFIKYHPEDSSRQKILPAHKVYISLLTQYNSLIRTLTNVLTDNGAENISPLRAYLNKINAK